MKNKIKALIIELKSENKDRGIAMNDNICSEFARTVLLSKYNGTLEVLKRLENIVDKN
jgi:hypothetical protein